MALDTVTIRDTGERKIFVFRFLLTVLKNFILLHDI